MGDEAIKKLARVQAVEKTAREEALSRALREEKTAAQDAERAQAAKQQALAAHEAQKRVLLETSTVSAETLLRRADDFERTRERLKQSETLEAQKKAALADASVASRQKRLAWADSKSLEKALGKKVQASQKKARDKREGRELD